MAAAQNDPSSESDRDRHADDATLGGATPERTLIVPLADQIPHSNQNDSAEEETTAEDLRDDVTLNVPVSAAPEGIANDATLAPPSGMPRGSTVDLGASDKAARLQAILDELPEMQRESIRLRHMERWPLEMIANRLKQTPVQVAGHLRKGMAALRGKLPSEL